MKNLMLPGNPRYQPKELQPMFGYDNLCKAAVEVEIATMKTLVEIGVISETAGATLSAAVEEALLEITTTEVDRVEKTDTDEYGKKTSHDIRALVRIAERKLPPELHRWLHVPNTSYDVLDTARVLQFVRGHEVVRSKTNKVISHLIERIRTFAATTQIGRTHGQHALPITVGFWLATILSRVLSNIQSANGAASKLVGKISGAVGAYNAQIGLGFSDCCNGWTFEDRVLEKLRLKPALISTQILPPEPLADYLFACLKLSATFGQFGRDGRNLMRTEIDELREPFEKGQVGSSTMAHKRNPINFENLEAMWIKNKNEFGKVLDTMISDHQRDLVGSAPARDFPTIVVNLVYQLNTLLRESDDGQPFISRISVNEEALKRNFSIQGDAILAEPWYIALQMAGYEGDAHELVNQKAMPYSRDYDKSLLDSVVSVLVEESPEVFKRVWVNIPADVMSMLEDPETYTGAAEEKAREVAGAGEAYLQTQRQ